MPISDVNWAPGGAMLLAGIIVGAMIIRYLQTARRPTAAPSSDSGALRDLEAKRDSLLARLREVDPIVSSDGTEADASERQLLELETAKVLHEIDQHKKLTTPGSPSGHPAVDSLLAPPSPHAPASTDPGAGMRGFIWGFCTAAALAGLVYFVSQSAATRPEGGSPTGSIPPMAGPAPTSTAPSGPMEGDAEVAALKSTIEKNPDNLEARLQLSRLHLMRRELMEVYNQTKYVLEKSPDNPQALSYQALVRMAMGQTSVALQMLRRAIEVDPDNLDAWLHLALVETQAGNFDEARKAMKEAMTRHPEESARLQEILGEIESRAKAGPPPPQPASGQPDPHSVPGASPAPVAPGAQIEATIDLDAATRGRVQPGSMIFVIARAAGVTTGPPVAAKRIAASAFPMTVSISAADSMMGQPLPALLRLEARADPDGNPLTKSPSDPSAVADNVRLGASGIRLVLK